MIQAGGQQAAFIITDVEDPTNPVVNGPWYWPNNSTYTPDIKAFDAEVLDENSLLVVKNYAVVGLERLTAGGTCGVVIIDITDGVYHGNVSETSGSGWCDVHNVFVDKDSAGFGTQIYVTADNTDDMRILDISGNNNSSPAAPVEIGVYAA